MVVPTNRKNNPVAPPSVHRWDAHQANGGRTAEDWAKNGVLRAARWDCFPALGGNLAGQDNGQTGHRFEINFCKNFCRLGIFLYICLL